MNQGMLPFPEFRSRMHELVEDFEKFHLENPPVWKLFCHFVDDRVEKGHKNYSARLIFGAIRWETDVKTTEKSVSCSVSSSG